MNQSRPRIPRIMISGVSGGVGKSLFMTGLIVALRKQGMSVSCVVVGEALHQSLIYTRLARRYCHTIDRALLGTDQIISTIKRAEVGADIVIIDGAGGFYDGPEPGDEFGSDADLALLTQTPVLLVTEARRPSNSVAAVIRGFAHYSQKEIVHGVVANRLEIEEEVGPILSSPVMVTMNACMSAYGLPPVIAGLPQASFPSQLPPSFCSQRENLTSLPRQLFLDVANLITNHVDLSELLAIAELAPELPSVEAEPESRCNVCRIAVSDDVCFNVAYQDNFAWLMHHGAEIVPFSPLADSELPKRIGGLYMTGGYLDSYGAELARNERLRESILAFAQRGGVVYSEGAGTAYLSKSYQVEPGGPTYPGVGLIPGEAVKESRPRGPLRATLIESSVLGAPGGIISGISLGDWALRAGAIGAAGSVLRDLRVTVQGGMPHDEGFSHSGQSLHTFHFLHFGSNREVARALVDAAEVGIHT